MFNGALGALSFNHFDSLCVAVPMLAANFLKKLVQRTTKLKGTCVGINTTSIFLAESII